MHTVCLLAADVCVSLSACSLRARRRRRRRRRRVGCRSHCQKRGARTGVSQVGHTCLCLQVSDERRHPTRRQMLGTAAEAWLGSRHHVSEERRRPTRRRKGMFVVGPEREPSSIGRGEDDATSGATTRRTASGGGESGGAARQKP